MRKRLNLPTLALASGLLLLLVRAVATRSSERGEWAPPRQTGRVRMVRHVYPADGETFPLNGRILVVLEREYPPELARWLTCELIGIEVEGLGVVAIVRSESLQAYEPRGFVDDLVLRNANSQPMFRSFVQNESGPAPRVRLVVFGETGARVDGAWVRAWGAETLSRLVGNDSTLASGQVRFMTPKALSKLSAATRTVATLFARGSLVLNTPRLIRPFLSKVGEVRTVPIHDSSSR